jgi:hypothetical protein
MFERALCDACGNIKEEKRDALAWLFSKSRKEYSATWWAELIEAEAILEQIRYVAKYGHYTKNRGRGFIKYGKHSWR